jgi:3'(2'), 5'-bisphosphate nucleotidase
VQHGLIQTAKDAAALLMQYYKTDLVVDNKQDKSPVTAADHAANALIMEALKALTPHIPVIAEESAETHAMDVSGAEAFWLVDPLDGTKSFIKQTDEFTVNMGLIVRGVPSWGIIAIPAQNLVYWTEDGKVLRQHSAHTTEIITTRTPPKEGLTVVASQSHYSDKTDVFLKEHTVAEFIQANSSLKFCRVAEGKADLYPRFGTTMEWDTAAGDALLRAAGGRTEHPDGKAFTYGKAGFENGNFVSYGWK